MTRRISALLVPLLFSATQASAYSTTMANTVKGDYAGKADSMLTVLTEQFMNKTKGTFYAIPKSNSSAAEETKYIYWQQAHAMDVLVYAYERHKDDDDATLARRYRTYMQAWFRNKANNYSPDMGSTGFENRFTDDMCWICLTLLHMTQATGTSTYATTARKVFDNSIMKRAVEDDTGLWLPWNSDNGSKANACTVGPACLIAVKLYDKYQDEKYLTYAEKLYNYMEKNIVKSDGRVEEPPLTYTQGTFGEACRLLFHATGKYIYRDKAKTYIEYAFNSGRCTNGAHILRDEGSSMDQSIFKAVLIPYAVNYVLDERMTLSSRRALSTYIQLNANTLWKVLDKDAYPQEMYCPYNWTKPYDNAKTASMGAMTSGASLLENCARMCIALTKPDVPEAIAAPKAAIQTSVKGTFTLSGQRVNSVWNGKSMLPAGVYVIDGRKQVIR